MSVKFVDSCKITWCLQNSDDKLKNFQRKKIPVRKFQKEQAIKTHLAMSVDNGLIHQSFP